MDSGQRTIRVGCCGLPVGLARYAQTLRVIEVQQTFYQPPALKTLTNWRDKVPSTFQFTLKAWQLITHQSGSPTYRRLREKLSQKQQREVSFFRVNATVMAAWHRTVECARALGSSIILFQCPASFTPTPEHKSNLRTFFREVDSEFPGGKGDRFTYIWEPRGPWKPTEIRNLCEELGLVQGGDPYQQEPVTPGLGYFRLHGRTGYRYRYTEADLEHLTGIARSRVRCYVLFNNISMFEDARRFQQLVSRGQTEPVGPSEPGRVWCLYF